jgi:hypothetical protein
MINIERCGRMRSWPDLVYYPGQKKESPNIARIDNVVRQVQCHLRAKMIVAHMDRLAPYPGTARDEQP